MPCLVRPQPKHIRLYMRTSKEKQEISIFVGLKTTFSAILHDKLLEWFIDYQNCLILGWNFTCPRQMGNPHCWTLPRDMMLKRQGIFIMCFQGASLHLMSTASIYHYCFIAQAYCSTNSLLKQSKKGQFSSAVCPQSPHRQQCFFTL